MNISTSSSAFPAPIPIPNQLDSLPKGSQLDKIQQKRRRTNFSVDEDLLFLQLVGQYGHDWNRISKYFEGRTPRSCKDHYVNVLSGTIKRTKFTAEEDSLLLHLYQIHGPRWTIIGHYFPDRPSISLRNRIASLQMKSAKYDTTNSGAEVDSSCIRNYNYNSFCSPQNLYMNEFTPYKNFNRSSESAQEPEIRSSIGNNIMQSLTDLDVAMFDIQEIYKISSLLL
ncbi:hypothetical protein TRFO_01689 [Tritrichomonas foetus]|uniref:Myb-like DNA-binding domain containing protein n=1 Tax=Tritrichomonas foetus TaxID=1144522 RepID=A0A1J4JQU2_9EUKA|nr:hypothetical protein TRFO_01689 [Tritrichomonas foetus]|eukprot:OHT01106.1 hypothetical protein TRFO_01689 [Tritrichomonas foetus]